MNLPELTALLWAGSPDNHSNLDTILKVAPLIPAFVAAAFKLAEDHGREKRKQTLIDGISKLAKNIAELPELPDSDATARLREAFHLELERSYNELKALQLKTPRRPVGFSSITAGLRSAFLLYRPQGFGAWLVHIGFYACLLVVAFMTLGYMASLSDPTKASSTSPGVVITIYTMLGIPPIIFWYFATKAHHRHCSAVEAAQATR